MSSPALTVTGSHLDEHFEQSRVAQQRADKWLISGGILIGTAALGIFGLPLFLRGCGCCARRSVTACRSGRCW